MINTATCGGEIAQLLSALNDPDECPKTIIYSLNPGLSLFTTDGAIMRCV